MDEELWARIEPLLPVVPRDPRRPGRKRPDSRKVLCGILSVLYTGRPLRRPKRLYADRGHDHEVYRDKVRRFQSWKERSRCCTGGRLHICREIRDDIHHAFVTLGCAVICWRRLRTTPC
ncbi:transposase [Kitasatospora sp. NPDC101157]|uniref:transposase n=1 Tax=Kitasatospora sp. NPDC101157 TaxID=3364098 RepID=UPI0038187283